MRTQTLAPGRGAPHSSCVIRSITLLLLLLAATRRASAQVTAPPPEYSVTSWTTREGLPQSSIYGLAHDAEGYLWVGTAAGLARFDGDSFVTYPRGRAEEGFAVTTFQTDSTGATWAATRDSGIRLLGPSGLQKRITGPSPRPIWVFAMASSDSMWMAYRNRIGLGHAGIRNVNCRRSADGRAAHR